MVRLIVVLMSFLVWIHQLSASAVFQIDTSGTSQRTNIPGEVGISFTPEQDSNYKKALSSEVSAHSRFEFESRLVSEALRTISSIAPQPSAWENIKRNLDIPAEMLAPSPQEVTQYQISIANAQNVPGVLLYPMGKGNFSATFGDIARVFGLTEDVSPVIAYRVDERMEVSIVIYSASAIEVRTLFRGIQAPGSYRVEWDGKMETGQIVPNGDYIVEVRLGNQRIVRKRIVVPFQ